MPHKSWFLNSSTKHFLVKNRSTQKWAFNYGKRSELTNKDIKVHLVEVTINFEVDLIHPLTNRPTSKLIDYRPFDFLKA